MDCSCQDCSSNLLVILATSVAASIFLMSTVILTTICVLVYTYKHKPKHGQLRWNWGTRCSCSCLTTENTPAVEEDSGSGSGNTSYNEPTVAHHSSKQESSSVIAVAMGWLKHGAFINWIESLKSRVLQRKDKLLLRDEDTPHSEANDTTTMTEEENSVDIDNGSALHHQQMDSVSDHSEGFQISRGVYANEELVPSDQELGCRNFHSASHEEMVTGKSSYIDDSYPKLALSESPHNILTPPNEALAGRSSSTEDNYLTKPTTRGLSESLHNSPTHTLAGETSTIEGNYPKLALAETSPTTCNPPPENHQPSIEDTTGEMDEATSSHQPPAAGLVINNRRNLSTSAKLTDANTSGKTKKRTQNQQNRKKKKRSNHSAIVHFNRLYQVPDTSEEYQNLLNNQSGNTDLYEIINSRKLE